MILPLANAGLPASELTEISRVSGLLENVLTDAAEASSFYASPARYFAAHGLDGSDRTLADSTVSMIVALADPAVKEALDTGDYPRLFHYMTAAGIFERRDPSLLQQRVQTAIESNARQITNMIGSTGFVELTGEQKGDMLAVLQDGGFVATENDLAIAAQLLSATRDVTIAACSAMAACFVGIALLVALYVSIAIAVTISILASISISLSAAVVVLANGKRSSDLMTFNGQFVRLDPVAVRNTQRTFQLAAISGDTGLQLHAMRSTIREEVTAVLASLSNLHLVDIPPVHMPLAIEAVYNYACKASGVSDATAY